MNDIAIAERREWQETIRGQTREFALVLPAHIKPERFARVAQTAILSNPDLLRADKRSVLAELVKCAQDGLLPDGREAAIVSVWERDPVTKEGRKGASYRPMLAGILKKARNSGEIASLHAEVAYEGETFRVHLGDNPTIEHERDLTAADDRPWIAVYAVATLRNGEKVRAMMTRAEVLRIRDRSDAWRAFKAGKIKSTPWSTDEIEMAKKTVIRRLSKLLPMSTDKEAALREAIERDDQDYPPIEHVSLDSLPPPRPASRLAAIEAALAPDDHDEIASSPEPIAPPADVVAPDDAAADVPPSAEPAAVGTQPAEFHIGPAMSADGITGKARQRILDLWNGLSECPTRADVIGYCGSEPWLAALKWLDEQGHARTRAALVARGSEMMNGEQA